MTAPERVWTEPEIAEQLTAHHEAAHVSACLLFGIPFDHVQLVSGWWSGRTRSGYVQTREEANSAKIDDEIVMMYAGLAAEAYWLECHSGNGTVKTDNGASDTAMAAELRRRFRTSTEAHLRHRADRLVRQRWDHITRTAEVLIERRKLSSVAAKRAGGTT